MSAISQWTLDEGTGTTVGDSVGSNTGTLNNSLGWSVVTAPLTFSNPGSLYAAAAYYVSLANDFSVGPSSSYSVSLWARWPATPTDRNPAFAFDSTNGDFGFSLGSTADGNGKIALEVSEYANGYQSCQGPTIVPDQWYHLCAVLRSGGTADLYVDGVYQASVTYDAFTTAIAAANGNGRTIGGEKYNGSVYWQASCYVDDVRTFDHELSGAEITALAARASGGAPLVSLTASTNSIAENGGAVSIIAMLDATASAAVTVAVGFSGAATTGSDYTLSTDTITIASGQTSGSLTATAINDLVYEGNETFTASITSVTGGGASASSTASTSVVTIVDDETQPTVNLSASTTTIAENGGIAYVAALLSNASFQQVQAGLSFGGTATANVDYSRSSIIITIPAGDTSGSISITALQDVLDEDNETITVQFGSIVNATAGATNSLSFTITDDDATPTLSLSASTTSIAENGGVGYFVGYLSAVSGRSASATIQFGSLPGNTATLDVDYTRSSPVAFSKSTLSFPAGQTSASVSVTALADTLFESTETITAVIGDFVNCVVGVPFSASMNIVNEYLPPFVSLSASTASITENSGSATVLATLDHSHSQNVTIVFGLGGTANSSSDYSVSTNSIVIASGATSGSISITALQDSISESPETVIVSLSSVTNGTAASAASVATVTIIDDDTRGAGTTGLSGLSGLSGIH